MDAISSNPLLDDASTAFSSYVKLLRQPLPDGELTPLFRRCRNHHFGPHDELHRLALAYVLAIKFGSNADVLHAARGKPMRRGETVDPVRIFVEAVTPTEGLSSRRAQQRHSRDTRAIRYLQAQKVRPQVVVEFGNKKGEGVHAWAGRQVTRTADSERAQARAQAGKKAEREMTAEVTVIHQDKTTVWKVSGKSKIEFLARFLLNHTERETGPVR